MERKFSTTHIIVVPYLFHDHHIMFKNILYDYYLYFVPLLFFHPGLGPALAELEQSNQTIR